MSALIDELSSLFLDYGLIIFAFTILGVGLIRKIKRNVDDERNAIIRSRKWVLAEYKWERGIFYPCQVIGLESEKFGTYTIRFYWGCLQPSTFGDQIKWDEPCEDASQLLPAPEPVETSASSQNGDDGLDIWVACRRGDIETVRRLAKAMKDINALEPILGKQSNDGRSALYWACLTGRVDIVELLLELGATDFDGSAFQAATCADPVRAKADQRDLLFDPDANIFTDNVVREAVARTDGSDDASKKIRALLAAARTDGLVPVPSTVFDRPATNCCVVCYEPFASKPPAVCSPCGHSSTCAPCLKLIRSQRKNGCPVCRQRIREIIPLVDIPKGS